LNDSHPPTRQAGRLPPEEKLSQCSWIQQSGFAFGYAGIILDRPLGDPE
jgi:hypothetical protein